MPTLLLSFKRISDSEILIHGALTPNSQRSAKVIEQHAADCPKFGPAWRNDETIQDELEVEAIPEFDQESIEEWVSELMDLEEDEEDEEEEEDEEDGDGDDEPEADDE